MIAVANWPESTKDHRILIAKRKKVNETVADVLVSHLEVEVVTALMQNDNSKIAHPAMEEATAMSEAHPHLVPILLKRPELKPSQALTMFWWAGHEERKRILQRFAVERLTLLEAAQDILARAAQDGWQDALVRKSLQFIERRQRNRAAAKEAHMAALKAQLRN